MGGAAVAPEPRAVTTYANERGLPGAATIDFDPSPTAPFFARPWPSELSRRDGRPVFDDYPGKDAPIFSRYVEAAREDVDGFSIAPVVYFHINGHVDPKVFAVSPKDTERASSPFLLVDVDPSSAERGTFRPVELKYVDADERYVPKGTLAMKPVAGFVLRSKTLYAAVVRRGATGLGTSDAFEHLKWTSPRADAVDEAARALHAPAFDELARLGVPRDDIAAIALFRTGEPEAVTHALLDVAARYPARVVDAEWDDAHENARGAGAYRVIRGHYCTPNFQSKTRNAPYVNAEGGTIELDSTGKPKVIAIENADPACGGAIKARFVLSIPKAPMPSAGYPLLVTAHGTGGDALTFLGDRNFAGWAAREGIAAISTDQPLHGGAEGGRPGASEKLTFSIAGFPLPIGNVSEIAFYNPFFPRTARDNLRQATADASVLVGLFGGLDFATVHEFQSDSSRPRPKFDRNRVVIAGHSQGSQSMAVLGALDARVRGVVLSGCGGDARLGILLREDLDVMAAVRVVLGVAPDELDAFHPMMSLVQALADPIDPQTYARLYWDPPPGRAKQNVLHFSGIRDTYTPPATADALAIALRATPLAPLARPVPSFDLAELVARPFARGDGGTRAFAQYDSTAGENGHFVLYHEPGASDLVRELFRTAWTGAATIGAVQ